jgi:tripartite-type tricarboxylate transporter receptor subunit TctC
MSIHIRKNSMILRLLGLLFSISLVQPLQAREVISVYWGWSLGDSLANYYRVLLQEANRLQEKYTFVLDVKSGAGGSIAVNHVLQTPNSMAAHTTAFFVRAHAFPRESYDPSLLVAQYVLCRTPVAVSSAVYPSWQAMPRDRAVTVGVSGLGVTTHAIAVQLQKRYPNMVIVPFRSSNDSMLSMIAGNTDVHVGFLSESEQWSKIPNRRRPQILGITGRQPVNGHATLIRQGFDPVFEDIYLVTNILVPKTLDPQKHKEFWQIFDRAARASSVRAAYSVDYCEPQNIPYDALQRFFDSQMVLWQRLASQIQIEQSK